MKSISIPKKRLLAIVQDIRSLSEVEPAERRLVIDTILKEIGVMELSHERLMCAKHARLARGYVDHANLYRKSAKGKLRVFHVCCKAFYERKQIESLPPKQRSGDVRERKVRVGMQQ